jgi:hypothetical protein
MGGPIRERSSCIPSLVVRLFVRRWPASQAAHHATQLYRVHRFCEEDVVTGPDRFDARVRVCVGSQRDCADALPAGKRPDPTDQLVAVHRRHRDVTHQHVRDPSRNYIQSLGRGLDGDHLGSALGQAHISDPPAPTRRATAQLTLFKLGRYHYQVLVTNLPLQPLNLWRFYNDRASVELLIRQLKGGLRLGRIPTRHFFANETYFHLLLLAYNLVNWFKRLCLPPELQAATLHLSP